LNFYEVKIRNEGGFGDAISIGVQFADGTTGNGEDSGRRSGERMKRKSTKVFPKEKKK